MEHQKWPKIIKNSIKKNLPKPSAAARSKTAEQAVPSSISKGLQRRGLIGSAVAGFNHAKTITKAAATDLHARQDDFNNGI